jgi:tRNA (cytidine56-2'-O)-methyltransferase
LPQVVVLRWGHRQRDERLTTHVALAARAFGASGIILADAKTEKLKRTVERVVENWGGSFFIEVGRPWKKVVEEWKLRNGFVVHLTVYGENIQTTDVLQRIKETKKNLLIIVGSQKVPREFFSKEVSDFNVAIGNQPHSECSSLAVFLDRYFDGDALSKEFKDAKIKIIPQVRGKKIAEIL